MAAVAAMGAASAQTSNTVYGVADAYVGSSSAGGMTVASGGYSTSRFGIKGSTDIGGGLKGSYMMETKVSLTNPNASLNVMNCNDLVVQCPVDGATVLGNRGASAGISGSFGTISMGNQFTGYTMSYFNDATEFDGFSPTWWSGSVSGIHADRVWQNHSLQYTTPTVGGFNANLMIAPNGDKSEGFDASSYSSVGVNLAVGGVSFAAGWESDKPRAPTGAGVTTTAWNVSAAAKAGAATVFAAFNGADNGTNKDAGWMISTAIPLDGTMSVQAGYSAEATNFAKEIKTTATSVVLLNDMNKQTRLYGGVVQTTRTDADNGSYVLVGVRYSF